MAPYLGVLAPFCLLLVYASSLPLDRILSVGGDDGFELSKAMLVERRPDLAVRMWNDQPWLHTVIQAKLFRQFGEHAAFPRAFSLASLGVLLWSLAHLLRDHIGFVAGAFMSTMLITAEGMPTWSMAAMCELPAISWGAAAAVVACTAPPGKERGRVILGGVLLAGAAHLKLTALIVVPAIALALLGKLGWRGGIRVVGWGAVGFIGVFGLLALASPNFDWRQIAMSHVRSSAALNASEKEAFAPHLVWFTGYPALLLGTLVGLNHPRLRCGEPALLWAVGLLLTAILLAVFYRPWWRYYMIHLEVPMALLSGAGMGWLLATLGLAFRPAAQRTAERVGNDYSRWQGSLRPGVALLWVSLLLGLGIGFELPAGLSNLEAIRSYQTADNSRLCAAMRPYAKRARWCFTEQQDLAFFAGVLIPPELVVVSHKRFWSGALDEAGLLRIAQSYQPAIIVIPEAKRSTQPAWNAWLTGEYVITEKVYGKEVWVTKSLDPYPRSGPEERLKRWGL